LSPIHRQSHRRHKEATNFVTQGPHEIALIDLGGRIPRSTSLEKIARKLNALQNTFHFSFLVKITALGEFDLLHGYKDGRFLGFVKDHLRGTEYRYGIGITHMPLLEHDAFNRHDQEHGRGVITFYNYKKYIPPSRDLEQYLAYLTLCETFCLVGKTHFEHKLKEACLFDMCLEKEDLRDCLTRPEIVEGTKKCQTRLRRVGFTAQDLEAGQRILEFVGRPKLEQLIPSLLSPASGVLIGLLGGELVAIFPQVVTLYLSLAIAGVLGATMTYNYQRAHKGD
jgi:hypothetical protein